ncbi:hypothetical protein [uncultured Rikenella sp.]|uniref:hypothetical protein n=1 Tax=uncultured Rikenella sp. TaxID=368003 RepID=UPI0025EB91E7|nr:hypothetical protein [uncultured Rikenella sp.]
MPLNGTFPYYSDGKEGEKYTNGDFKATNGRLYKVSTSGTGTPLAWYPAPGLRERANGGLVNVGIHGFSWSSVIGGISGLDLNFHSQILNASASDCRAHGFQLRCLSE